MSCLYQTSRFEKDLERLAKSAASRNETAKVKEEPALVIGRLIFDVALARRHVDHELPGDWQGFRDCHVFTDLVLIYRKYNKNVLHKTYGANALIMARIGSHSELDL